MDQEELVRIKALVFSYLWVAAADGDISVEECGKFNEALEVSGFKPTVSADDIKHIFDDAIDFFKIKYEKAEKEARERLAELKVEDGFARQVIAISRKAIIADEVLEDQEELVVKEIAKILGISGF